MPSTAKVNEAHRKGYRGDIVTEAIAAHERRRETAKPWSEVIDHDDPEAVLRMRGRLTRDGVLTEYVLNPSELARGRVRALLREMEKRDSDTIHGGNSADGWKAAAEYVDSYFSRDDVSQLDVAEANNCSRSTVSRLYPKIVNSDVFDAVYAPEISLRHSVRASLSDVRATDEMLAIRLGEPTKAVKRRIKASEYGTDLNREEFGGKTFFWGKYDQ